MNKNNLEDWLEKEEEWLEKQGLVEDVIWYPKMIEIYKHLIQLSPESADYRLWLGQYLMDHAIDMKLRHQNYRTAKKSFEEVLILQPSNGVAMYHLGYIHFMDEYWREALTFLEQALQTKDLSKQQKVRGLLASALCLHKLQRIDDADDIYHEAKTLDSNFEHSTEFQLARAQMVDLGIDEHKPYILETLDQDIIYLSEEEAYDLLGTASKDHLILNFTEEYRPRFLSEKAAVVLQAKEAQLLRELLLSSHVKSNQQLLKAVWTETEDLDLVKKYVSKLRKKLALCFAEPMTDVIKTIPRKGYRWNFSKQISIISIIKGLL